MSIAQLLTQPCTIIRRTESGSGAIDAYGRELPDEATVETVCELQQLQQRADGEPEGQGEFSDSTWLLVLPAGTEATTGDVVTVEGRRFEMFGEPWHVRHPRTGVESHVEANVRRTAGAEDAS